MRLSGALDRVLQDVRYAVRMWRRTPGFTSVVALILALGIGANTAVFSLLDGVVLKSLPVERPDELVWFRHPGFSYPIFEQVRARERIFSGLFAWDIEELNVEWGEELESTQTLLASGEFYPTLGVEAIAGRTLGPQDDRPGGGAQGLVAVISEECWRRRFGGNPGIVGKTVRIERLPFMIIGVTRRGFFGVAAGMAPEITIPLTTFPTLKPEEADILRSPTSAWLHLMGRLKPGLTLQQAESALQTFWPQVMEATTNPGMPPDRRARYLSRRTRLEPGRSGFSRVRNQFAGPLWVLLALVGLLLLVACATVANLLLARVAARRREIAVRLALGAGRSRIVGQLMTEGLMLAGLGALSGLLVASWSSEGLVRLLSTTRDPIALDLAPDSRVLTFTVALAAATAILFALAPAYRATAVDPGPALKEAASVLREGRRRWWLGKSLVVSQVALSMLLLVGAALFTRSLTLLLSQDAGFDRTNLFIVSTDPLFAGYRGPRLVTYYAQLLERIKAAPGVRSASLSYVPPISNDMGSWTQSISIDGAPPQPESETYTFFSAVSAGYFDTVGTRLLQGRDFGPADDESGPRTVIINESLARAFFPHQNRLGRRISIGRHAARRNLEIVGVVQDAKYQRLQEPTRRIAYVPYRQFPEFAGGSNLVAEVRVAAASTAVADAIRRQIRALDRAVPVRLETVTDRIRESLVKERVLAIMSAVLGGVALLLASAGLYGLMAYTVSRRTNEIGIRIALGAAERTVLWMVLRESLVVAALGLAAGLGASLALGRLIGRWLYGLTGTDPVALGAASTIMLGVAMVAAYLPARRAARVDPTVALRRE
jgi:predicted permease